MTHSNVDTPHKTLTEQHTRAHWLKINPKLFTLLITGSGCVHVGIASQDKSEGGRNYRGKYLLTKLLLREQTQETHKITVNEIERQLFLFFCFFTKQE
jgi:hypothetical protein